MKTLTIDVQLTDQYEDFDDAVAEVHAFIEGALEIAGFAPADVSFGETTFSHSDDDGEHYHVQLHAPDHLADAIRQHFAAGIDGRVL